MSDVPKKRWLTGGKYKVNERQYKLVLVAIRRHNNTDYTVPGRRDRVTRILTAAAGPSGQVWVRKYVAKWEAQDQLTESNHERDDEH